MVLFDGLGAFGGGASKEIGNLIDSGVVEAGCKAAIGARCKQSGVFWSKSGAENILALRCIHSNRRLEDYWKHRLNTKAASNDCLPLAAQYEEFCLTPRGRMFPY
jgi:hypothetical protein